MLSSRNRKQWWKILYTYFTYKLIVKLVVIDAQLIFRYKNNKLCSFWLSLFCFKTDFFSMLFSMTKNIYNIYKQTTIKKNKSAFNLLTLIVLLECFF